MNYSQPSKKGRLIFGTKQQKAFVQFGEKWRTGANEATEITFSSPVVIDGKSLQAGTYSIYTIPNEDNWIVAFNSRTDYWGKSLFGSPFKEKYDVLRTVVETKKTDESIEIFTIEAIKSDQDSMLLKLKWDTTFVQLVIDSAQH